MMTNALKWIAGAGGRGWTTMVNGHILTVTKMRAFDSRNKPAWAYIGRCDTSAPTSPARVHLTRKAAEDYIVEFALAIKPKAVKGKVL